MKQITVLRAFLILIPLVAVGCDDSPSTRNKESQVTAADVGESLDETMETTEGFLEQKADKFQKKIETQLQALEAKHQELTAQAKKAGTEANAELQATLDELEKKKQRILERMGALQESSGQALEDLEAGIDHAVAELEEAYQKAQSRFADKA